MRLVRLIRAHPDAASALALMVLPFLVFARALVPGRVLSAADVLFLTYPWRGLAPGLRPGNDLLTDPAYLFQPWLIYAVSEVWQGRIPLWNPHVFAGSPFFANPQSALLFPLNWVALIVPVASAFALIAILKVAAIGLATYWFLRVRALHPLAALMGAVSFMWSGLVVVWLQWTNSTTLIFFPMLFASVEWMRIRPGRRSIAVVALTVALGVWAGYPQGLALALASASAWALWRAHGAGVPFLLRYAGGIALGLSLAAIQLLPFVEYARLSSVLATRETWMPPLSASLRSAISLLVPYYYGSPTGGDYWGDWNFNETAVSVGLAPWLLLPLALIARRPAAWFFALMAIAGGLRLYGLGPEAAAGSLVINFRLAPIFVFPLCVLAAIGMDTLLTEPTRLSPRHRAVIKITFVAVVTVVFLAFAADYATMRRLGLAAVSPARYLWFLALFTASAALCLTGVSRRALAWALALIGIQLTSLAPLALSYNPVIDARLLYPIPPALARLQQEVVEAPGRVLMAPNLAMLYGLEGVAAYDGMTPRHLDEAIRSETSALNLIGSGYLPEVPVFLSPVRDLLGIRHVLVPPDVTLDGPGLSLRYHGADGRIYRNEAALPRAFVTTEARCVETEEVLKRLRTRTVDFRREVLLSDCVNATTPGDDRSPRGNAPSSGTARIERYRADRVTISAESERGGYLVLTDAWFPGWTASVDGRETRIERADHAFRAVKLGPGRHDVEFRYAPMSVRLGLALSVLAAVVTGALAWPRTASQLTSASSMRAFVGGCR